MATAAPVPAARLVTDAGANDKSDISDLIAILREQITAINALLTVNQGPQFAAHSRHGQIKKTDYKEQAGQIDQAELTATLVAAPPQSVAAKDVVADFAPFAVGHIVVMNELRSMLAPFAPGVSIDAGTQLAQLKTIGGPGGGPALVARLVDTWPKFAPYSINLQPGDFVYCYYVKNVADITTAALLARGASAEPGQ